MKDFKLDRRDVLKGICLAGAGAGIFKPVFGGADANSLTAKPLRNDDFVMPTKPMTAVVLGAGNRGNVYAGYALANPQELKIVGVAEPLKYRNDRMAKAHGIEDKYRWDTWERAFEIPKFADVMIITMQDCMHYKPAMKALEMGYDVLLEKPIAQSWEQCSDILKSARKHNAIIGVGHVLRYTPYFRKIKEDVQSGRIGQIMNIELLEPVGYNHISHSYVRGPWRRVEDSNPILLAKSCHDLDIIRWLIDKPCKRVSSFGSLKWFKKENAPTGSTPRCTDGCRVEAECPWSSRKIYLRDRQWLSYLQLEQETDEQILKAIKEGPYGQCVFQCDNNVLDHQVVILDFDEQVTASFTMAMAKPHGGGRFIRVMGTKGEIVGDWENVMTTEFQSLKTETWSVAANSKITSGHGGGDYGLMRNFIQAVTRKDESLLTSNLEASMASHFIGFNAEQSRLTGKVVDLEDMI